MATKTISADEAMELGSELDGPNAGTEPEVEPEATEASASDGKPVNVRENVQVGAPSGYRKVIALAVHIAADAPEALDANIAGSVAALLQSEADGNNLTLDVEQLKHHFILTLETEASAAAKAARKSTKSSAAPKELTADDGGLLFRKVEQEIKRLAKESPDTTMADRRKQARETVATANGITVERLRELIAEFLGV